jgi:nucleoid-associated protein YgaU
MNTSYKIVLLGAFVLFAAVVGYYILSGDGKSPDELVLNDEYTEDRSAQQPAPKPRTTLDTMPPAVEPEPEPEPVIEAPVEETIGETTEEVPEAPVLDREIALGPVASSDPPDVLERPIYEPAEGPATEDPVVPSEETTDPIDEDRPAPETDDPDPAEETSDPEIDPVVEPEVEPSPRPIPPDPATIPRTYTVKAGDTFASIALAYYGEERAWFDIAQANPSVDPKRLQVGQEIVLPNRDATVREREEVQPPAPGKDQTYAVRPGDNLSKIAKKFYNDSEKWDLIYARNRQLIGPRPDALKVGMELVIPQAYEGAE